MPARKPLPPDAKPQSERFIEMAHELGCDEDEAAFKAKLAGIVQHKPSPGPQSAQRGKRGRSASDSESR